MDHGHKLERPDADAMLAAINTQRKRKRGGKLHLYLGMAPGVGKTYAMLMAAQEALSAGYSVVIGVVETHGRHETQELLKSLEFIPKRQVKYRDILFEEMDLDGILARMPKIVVVDELAHSNVPGSRHPKRWQDIFELLDAGIDVYSTLNVQHLESRKDSVEQIAQTSVRETVPDSVLDRAYQIRLIDLSPAELLKRLKEGKVYLGENAELASQNFFQEEKLTALREIALRLAAEKVDTELQTFTASREAGTPWQTVDRLMVALDQTQSNQDVIRSTRRLAFNLEGPWIAVHVNTGHILSSKEQSQLAINIELARSLGAEVITVSATNIAQALMRIARQRNVTQIVIGKSRKHWLTNTLQELVYDQNDISILVQGYQKSKQSPKTYWGRLFQSKIQFSDYAKAFWIFMGLTIPVTFFKAPFLYLLGIAYLSFQGSLGSVFSHALLACFATYYLQFESLFFASTSYFSLAAVGGILSNRLKVTRDLLSQREERSSLLFEAIREISSAQNREDMLPALEIRIGSYLNGVCKIHLKRKDNSLKPLLGDSELGLAKWVLNNQKPAGWSTDTLPGSKALCLPLSGHKEALGICLFKPNNQKKESLNEANRNLLLTLTRQLALSLEKELFKERAGEANRLQEVNQLHKSILSFMADELRSPLSVIVQAVAIMSDRDSTILPERRIEMGLHLLSATEKLGFVVDNLLTLSRLSVGLFPIRRTLTTPNRLLQIARDHLKRSLEHTPIQLEAEPNLPSIQVDVALVEQALANILLNASQYTPENKTIKVSMKTVGSEIHIAVTDQGPGIPEEYLGRVFERFYRYPGSKDQGAGIGLAVAKGVIRAHEGKITVQNLPEGGTCFTVSLPLAKQA
ncbi:MAG: sensor histidine kinase KdpD [Deltaproteobacteria bacterium]|nr:sensor histidine kinase KdpD [Deltaproteobacteria bacterium]